MYKDKGGDRRPREFHTLIKAGQGLEDRVSYRHFWAREHSWYKDHKVKNMYEIRHIWQASVMKAH